MSKIDALVALADIHAGSKYAPCPPEFEGENTIIKANAYQRWLYDCLSDALEWTSNVLRGRKWGLVINGDAIEGIHHRTTEVVSADVADHKGIAERLLAPWSERAESVWMVEGTECHTHGHESSIAKAIGAVPYKAPTHGLKRAAWPELPIEICGCYGIVRHHITTSIRPWTEATGLCSQLNSERVEHARNDARQPRWMIYAHRHKEGHWSDGHASVWTLPPWQGLTRHGRKVVGHARFTRPGVLILDFRGVEDDGLPFARRRVYGAFTGESIVKA